MVTIAPTMEAFARECVRLSPGSQNGGIAPGDPNQGGYHNSRDRLLALGKTGDYSLRHQWDNRGNSSRARAFDWTFPDAQAGRYGTIRTYGNRVRDAYRRRDPRLAGWREVLIRTDEGIQGFDFVGWYIRTPDGTHGWHGHFSCMNEFVDETWPYNNMLSILRGDPPGGEDVALDTGEKAWLSNADNYLWKLHTLDPSIEGIKDQSGTSGTLNSELVPKLVKLFEDVEEIRSAVAALEVGGVTEDMLERVVRRVLGGVDGAVPPGQ